jgi:hypothetical protein
MAVAWSWEKTRQWLLLASPARGKLLVAAGYYSMAQREIFLLETAWSTAVAYKKAKKTRSR